MITLSNLDKVAYLIGSNGVYGCSNLHSRSIAVRKSVGGRFVADVSCNDCSRTSKYFEYANVAKKRGALKY